MAKNEEMDLAAGLEEGVAGTEPTQEEKTTRRRKEQTPEDVEAIVAGVEKLKELGISEKTAIILTNLAPVWNGSDKEAIQAAKEVVINAFGGSENLKDFIDADFQKEFLPFLGIARVVPIANNIKSFYARRSSSKKPATVQVNIGGTLYNVEKAYYESIADKSKEEKRELLLAHPATVKAGDVPEIL